METCVLRTMGMFNIKLKVVMVSLTAVKSLLLCKDHIVLLYHYLQKVSLKAIYYNTITTSLMTVIFIIH